MDGITKEEDFNKAAKNNYQSINDLFGRRLLIKGKLAEANGIVKIKIAGKEMTITDAINQKHMIGLRKVFVNDLRSKYTQLSNELDRNNKIVEQNALKLAETALGKDNVKAGVQDVTSITEPYLKIHKFLVVDPLNLLKTIQTLEEEVENFESEVDTVLSEANATNFIEL